MGIAGLLKLLTKITKDKNISEYSGKKVAVDTYCWLHQGIYFCAGDIAQEKFTS